MDEKDSRILVVDDEQDLCEILKFNLETEGYQVAPIRQKRLWRKTLRLTISCSSM